MLLVDLDRYLKERGVVSLRLTIEERGYMCVARTTHGRTITTRGQCDVDSAVDQVLVTMLATDGE
jgi:hypothetical protein